MATPTTEQIQQVQTNLANLISLNSALLEGGNMRIENAFTLVSMNDDTDPGINVGANLLDSAFLMAGDLFPGGVIAATFACAVVANYTTVTPPSLLGTASSLLDRFQLTNYQFNSDLEMFNSNVEEYWDVVYGGSVVNAFGTTPVSGSLSDLANVVIPGPDDEGFQNLVNVLVYGTDQVVWFTLLQNFQIETEVVGGGGECDPTQEQEQQVLNQYYAQSPQPYYTLSCEDGEGQLNSSALLKDSQDDLSVDAANYLFNNWYGDVANPSATQNTYTRGLYAREMVYTGMGLTAVQSKKH